MATWTIDEPRKLTFDTVRRLRVRTVAGGIAVVGTDDRPTLEVSELDGPPLRVRHEDGELEVAYERPGWPGPFGWLIGRHRRQVAVISLAVPRGFLRPGAVAPGAAVEIRRAMENDVLAAFTADARGGFEVKLDSGHAIERALEGGGALALVARDPEGNTTQIELVAEGHGGHGRSIARASDRGSPGGTRSPETPSSTTSSNPPVRVAITGTPAPNAIWAMPEPVASR